MRTRRIRLVVEISANHRRGYVRSGQRRAANGLPEDQRRICQQEHSENPVARESHSRPQLENRRGQDRTGGDRTQHLRIGEYGFPDRRPSQRFFGDHDHVARLPRYIQAIS
jgi:hypothetical protein